jgi:HAD superfamily phosphoserine phosphatase-like hydrolase
MPVAYLCDFDGTIAPDDIGARYVERFGTLGANEREALVERWRRGTIGSRELTLAECEGLSATEEASLEFVRPFRLDPRFAPFVREARGRGDAVMVVSDGFDFYVRDHLDRAGLGDLPWAANRVRFTGASLALEFPFQEGGCGRCGNCKAPHVRRYQALGFHAVMVGNGLSDRCGALAADRVLARGDLLEWCRAERVSAEPFESFADVADFGRRQLAGALPRRG